MKEKTGLVLPVVLMVVFAVTRWPGLMPLNFSAAYALAYCAGVYFPRRWAWILPIATLAVTDLVLNLYYHYHLGINSFRPMQFANYAAYVILIWLGTRSNPQSSFGKLLGGGILGALLFYLVTNTAAWFFNPFGNPEYTPNFVGWLIALTQGTKGWPETWRFLLNTMLSGGLFTGLFVGAMKLTTQAESAKEKETQHAPAGEDAGEAAGTPTPEEARS